MIDERRPLTDGSLQMQNADICCDCHRSTIIGQPDFTMQQQELIPHLFRTEFTKITSVLCKLFGIEHIEIAEDIAGETFLM